MPRYLGYLLLLPLLALCCMQHPAAGESALFGSWLLDVEKSDDIQATIDGFLRHNKPPRRPSKRGTDARPSVAAAAGISTDGEGRVDLVVSDYLPLATLLHIESKPNGIEIRYEGGEPRLISTSGKTSSVSAVGKPLDGHRSVAIAGWEKGNLYSELTTERGVHIFESYLLSGSNLTIETEIRYPVLDPLIVTRRFNKVAAK